MLHIEPRFRYYKTSATAPRSVFNKLTKQNLRKPYCHREARFKNFAFEVESISKTLVCKIVYSSRKKMA